MDEFGTSPKIAPAAKRQRAEFIRQALKDAIRKREYEAIREAYLRQPDSANDAEDPSGAAAHRGMISRIL